MISTARSARRHRDMPGLSAWPLPRRLVCAIAFLLSTAPAYSQPSQASAPPFVIAADVEPGTYVYRWATLIYGEAFKRLGIPVQFATYSLARRAALANEGGIDGEVSRIYAYADTHPELIRVEEPVMGFTFSLFTANPAVNLKRVEDLAATPLLAEYRRGILMCENTLRKFVPPERLSDVTGSEQGVKKLLAARTDVYCDIDLYVRQALNSPELRGAANVRKLFNIASVPTYPYLNKKHAELAPRLAATLKQMKAEGLLDAYPLQAEREMGWAR